MRRMIPWISCRKIVTSMAKNQAPTFPSTIQPFLSTIQRSPWLKMNWVWPPNLIQSNPAVSSSTCKRSAHYLKSLTASLLIIAKRNKSNTKRPSSLWKNSLTLRITLRMCASLKNKMTRSSISLSEKSRNSNFCIAQVKIISKYRSFIMLVIAKNIPFCWLRLSSEGKSGHILRWNMKV